jgi:hypothetical protein
MTEKNKPLLQISGDPTEIAEESSKKILDNIKARREQLRSWLREHGMLREVKKHE